MMFCSRTILLVLVLYFVVLPGYGGGTATEVNISNVDLRRDINGEWMDVHDGLITNFASYTPFDRKYYYYGIGYQNCTIEESLCGFRVDRAIRLYSSYDLSEWTLESGDVFPVSTRPYGIYFRPKVVYNPRTLKYVLWVNYLANASSPLAAYPSAQLLVAESDTPVGPFALLHAADRLGYAGPGDFTLITTKPPNGGDIEAYIAYGAWSNSHTISIERLDGNFTNSLGLASSSGLISPQGNEAPVLFERDGYYYLFFGACCCFCQEGADTTAYVATNLLGPWSPLLPTIQHNATGGEAVDLNPVVDPNTKTRIISSQNNYVFTMVDYPATNATTYVWMGDRWASAADRVFGHDLQSWVVLQFDDSVAPARIAEFVWQDWFMLKVPPL